MANSLDSGSTFKTYMYTYMYIYTEEAGQMGQEEGLAPSQNWPICVHLDTLLIYILYKYKVLMVEILMNSGKEKFDVKF